MKNFLSIYGRVLKGLGKVLKYFGILLLAAIVASIFVQVISRYVFGRPHVWVEEFATYCFIWTVFIGAAYALLQGRHIIVTTITDYFSPMVKKILAVCINLAILFFLYNSLKYGLRQFSVEAPQSTIALPWRLPRRWFYSLPFLVSMASMFLTTVHSFLVNITTLREKKG
jgi:TRAP-type C4-dicarboxylate transport system permease small subunit